MTKPNPTPAKPVKAWALKDDDLIYGVLCETREEARRVKLSYARLYRAVPRVVRVLITEVGGGKGKKQ